jgi:hypothetical protein
MGRHLQTSQQKKCNLTESEVSRLKNVKNLKKFLSAQSIHRNISISIWLLLASPQKYKAQSTEAFFS